MCETPFRLKREMAETSQEELSFWSSQFGFDWERSAEASAPMSFWTRDVFVFLTGALSTVVLSHPRPGTFRCVCERVQMHMALEELRVDSFHLQPEGMAFW